ncbi:hypothetical protein MesoLj113a_50330 [Mesorhizobium sp. 113-1-2]|uniref:hypothetical protein n=1 Tax=Mesorhizobium sp. 113-1-2 TaxID=2744515 RepID=UPI0019257BCE|nr:hypothetical protein [Mesorhizobium sp. 113-1-2]BCG73875.1 hypothetical protein MesoLj113a_50330 [Mesorhizobium sp. 113-1-2]
MTKLVEYQDADVSVLSRKPLRGALELVTDDDDTVSLELDRDTAEQLMSALVQFLMEGQGPDRPTLRLDRDVEDAVASDDERRQRDQVLTAIHEGILAAYQATLYENNDPFDNCATFAETALASLESVGFKVVR